LRNIVAERLTIVADDLAAAGDHAIFKKVDSTLMGNLAVELRVVMAGRDGSCVVAAPAFPAIDRTTRGGRQLLNGTPLELTEFAPQVDSSVLRHLLEPAGLAAREVPVEEVRDDRVGELVEAACASGGEILICDAETEEDLQRIARGGATCASGGPSPSIADALGSGRDCALTLRDAGTRRTSDAWAVAPWPLSLRPRSGGPADWCSPGAGGNIGAGLRLEARARARGGARPQQSAKIAPSRAQGRMVWRRARAGQLPGRLKGGGRR
jgi:Sugar-binding N-terminal domain